jgi:hypothetical protein
MNKKSVPRGALFAAAHKRPMDESTADTPRLDLPLSLI